MNDNFKKTCQERFKCDNPFQNKEIKYKIEQTNLDRYKCKNPSGNTEVKEKKKQTLTQNYNCDNPSRSPIIQKRKEETCLEKYGVTHSSKRNQSKFAYDIIIDKDRFEKFIIENGAKTATKLLGLSSSMVYKIAKRYKLKLFSNKSSLNEKEISVWLENNNIFHIRNDRKQLKPKELDFYFPEHNLAIEFQGDYWHMNPKFYSSTDSRKGKFAHEIWKNDMEKRNMCQNKNIDLIEIWESEWEQNKELIKEKILLKVGKS
jgi:hypothetical protein